MNYNLQDENKTKININNLKEKTELPKLRSDLKDKTPQMEDWAMLEFIDNEINNISKIKNLNS